MFAAFSATVERIFPEISFNKIKIRNKLKTSALIGILRSKTYLKREKKIVSMNVKKDMIKITLRDLRIGNVRNKKSHRSL